MAKETQESFTLDLKAQLYSKFLAFWREQEDKYRQTGYQAPDTGHRPHPSNHSLNS